MKDRVSKEEVVAGAFFGMCSTVVEEADRVQAEWQSLSQAATGWG